jgi:hypothetical protein
MRVDDREVSKTFIRRRDAHAYATTIEVDKLRGVAIDPRAGRLTVEELAQRWLDSNPAKRPDTRATDEYHLRAHVNPVLGKRQIANVTPSHVQGLANDLAARLAPKTVRRALGVVRAMFAHAVADDLLGRSPYRGIKLPRVDPTRRRIPSSDELAGLIEAIRLSATRRWSIAQLCSGCASRRSLDCVSGKSTRSEECWVLPRR